MIIAIIQARMGSTRLPGKIMKELCGKPQLWHVVKRVESCAAVDKVVLATSTAPENDAVEIFCHKSDIDCFRGDEQDVLDRYYQAALSVGAKSGDAIMRITADCPVIDPKIIGELIALFQQEKPDYASNVFPPTYPDGLDAEIFAFDTLEKVWREAEEKAEREHVTLRIRNRSNEFAIVNLAQEQDQSSMRWTVDEPADFEVIKAVYENLYREGKVFTFSEILDFFALHPEIAKLNEKFQRNEGMNQ